VEQMKITVFGTQSNNHGLVCGDPGKARQIDHTEVAALAKVCWQGLVGTSFFFRLTDGEIVYVNAADQDRPVERWIRQQAKGIRRPSVVDGGWNWGDIKRAPNPRAGHRNRLHLANACQRVFAAGQAGGDDAAMARAWLEIGTHAATGYWASDIPIARFRK
jgi:hypothetical protein